MNVADQYHPYPLWRVFKRWRAHETCAYIILSFARITRSYCGWNKGLFMTRSNPMRLLNTDILAIWLRSGAENVWGVSSASSGCRHPGLCWWFQFFGQFASAVIPWSAPVVWRTARARAHVRCGQADSFAFSSGCCFFFICRHAYYIWNKSLLWQLLS